MKRGRSYVVFYCIKTVVFRNFTIDAGSSPTWGSELQPTEIYIFFTLAIDAGSIPTWGSEVLPNEIDIFFPLSSLTLCFCLNLNLLLINTGLTSRQRITHPILLNINCEFTIAF